MAMRRDLHRPNLYRRSTYFQASSMCTEAHFSILLRRDHVTSPLPFSWFVIHPMSYFGFRRRKTNWCISMAEIATGGGVADGGTVAPLKTDERIKVSF